MLHVTTITKLFVNSAMAAGKASVEMLKNAVISQARTKQTAAVIFLHGLGDTGDGWCSILSELQQPHVKLICPTAPIRPVTINRGMRMPAWFDVIGLGGTGKQDDEGIMAAVTKVHELLDYEQESAGIPSNRIILGGFSQGGSLAMLAALMYTKPLAGIAALSTYMSLYEKVSQMMSSVNNETPFLQCHGEADEVVPYQAGERTSKFIQTFNKSHYQFKSYAYLGHSSSPEEMTDLSEWIAKHLPQVAANM